MKIVSLIPARGGSKGIPMKNIVQLNGRPLISYVLQASLGSRVDETWVSTDNTMIEKVCLRQDKRINILKRPSELARDDSTTEDAMFHFAYWVTFDVVVLIQPTSPMVTSEQIDRGLKTFESGEYDSVFSAAKVNDMLTWKKKEYGLYPLNYDPWHRGRRQMREEAFFIETGGFYIISREHLLNAKCRMSRERIGVVEVPFWMSFQVDTQEDLKNIERLMI